MDELIIYLHWILHFVHENDYWMVFYFYAADNFIVKVKCDWRSDQLLIAQHINSYGSPKTVRSIPWNDEFFLLSMNHYFIKKQRISWHIVLF